MGGRSVERDAIIAEIERAFKDVGRGGGISWSECEVIDDYGRGAERNKARRSDRETHWRELVDDKKWNPFPGMGGFSFIDQVGFKYYLPPTMIQMLRGDAEEWFPGHLLGVISRFTGESQGPWSREQGRAIARFVQFMSRTDTDEESREAWVNALIARWGAWLRE